MLQNRSGRGLRSEKGNPKREKSQRKKENKNTSLISFRESDIAQRYLISSEGCPSCAQIHRDLKKEFKSGKLIDLDVGDEKGFEIVKYLGLDSVPAFIVELRDDHPSKTKYILDE